MTTENSGGNPPPVDTEDRALLWEALGNSFRPYAGWIFYGFGALFVVLGYFGISGEATVAKQVPYLISGGIGGILLAILGAYLLGIEELRKDSGRLDTMERQIEQLHAALLSRPDAPAVAETVVRAESNGHVAMDHVIIVESGASFHRPGCRLVDGKPTTALSTVDASDRGLAPCKVCEPLISVA